MRAKKIQTTFGRKIFEKGFIPKRGHLDSFWEGSKPLFEIVDIDLDELPEGTILRVNREVRDQNPLYFRRETGTTGESWMLLRKEGETPLDDHAVVPSTWLGFEHATQLMIIYIPEN